MDSPSWGLAVFLSGIMTRRSAYWFARVWIKACQQCWRHPGPTKVLQLSGNMGEILDLTPVSYQVRVVVPEARSAAQDEIRRGI